MNKFQLARANVSDALFDFRAQVRAFFTPSDYTREAFSTVTRGWVAWQAFIIGINLVSSIFYLFQSEWLLSFLYFLVSALFALLAMWELMLNVARKAIQNLLEVCHAQQATLHQMLDDFEMINGAPVRGEEFD